MLPLFLAGHSEHAQCFAFFQAAAAAAAKSLQSCPTLCDPIDSSPLGSPVPGILQARTLEWVAISFLRIHISLLRDFIFLDFKITADGDCSHEIKRHLLLGRKAMTKLDSMLKSRDIA